MKDDEIINYITNELKEINSTEERKNTLLSVLFSLFEQGIEVENLEQLYAQNSKQLNIPVNNNHNEIPSNRSGYDCLLVPVDNTTKKIFSGMVKFDKPIDVLVVGDRVANDGVQRFVNVLLKNKSELADVVARLNEDDKRTFSAISNLIYEGKFQVTPVQLYRKAHMNPNIHPTEEQLKRQDNSIRKMASIYLKLDTKEILEIYPELERIPIGANFIEVKEWYGRTANGSYSNTYEFKGVPILFEYALILRQVEKIQKGERSPYTTPLRKTKENEFIVQIIGDRVLALKNNGRVNKKITYEKLFSGIDFSKCNSEQAIYNKKSRKKKEIKRQLSFLRTAEIIGDFREVEDGTGIEITM